MWNTQSNVPSTTTQYTLVSVINQIINFKEGLMSTTSLRSDHNNQIFLDFAGCLVCTDFPCVQYVCTLP